MALTSMVSVTEPELSIAERELDVAEMAYLQQVELYASVLLSDEPRTY